MQIFFQIILLLASVKCFAETSTQKPVVFNQKTITAIVTFGEQPLISDSLQIFEQEKRTILQKIASLNPTDIASKNRLLEDLRSLDREVLAAKTNSAKVQRPAQTSQVVYLQSPARALPRPTLSASTTPTQSPLPVQAKESQPLDTLVVYEGWDILKNFGKKGTAP